ncbi:glycosyltransferase family 2 protein [Actinomadura violacea]|uniref:Glycosyltransferase family 2 protein n=1 Tax=Actinomadura violacea TaxID=2819934 RepID=A0ABS3RYD1_9ACTN|nr:glycosyltransferase family 2 protein [Actinomadura violacea]MBO2461767.1 glycosyltransferase family 2 protein [Actinomadura violacea]
MGDRPRQLADLLASVAKQDVAPEQVVLIGNATPLDDVSADVVKVPLEENLGCPGGRNVGLKLLCGSGRVDVIVELDDDGLLVADDVFRKIQQLYASDPELGIVSFRIADEQGETQRRHVPRLRADDPMRAGQVTAFLGGAHVLSVPMLNQIGDWPERFFFCHEETDMAWRALDAGWKIIYEPSLVLEHPKTSPARHAVYFRMTARNRVWLARRRLPLLLIPVYLGVWIGLTVLRIRSASGLMKWLGGFWEGLHSDCGERRPMRWRTVWRMTRLGRPPLV